jgi:hypothetical protein
MSIEERKKQRNEESKSNNKKKNKNTIFVFLGIIAIPLLWGAYISVTKSPCNCYEAETDKFIDDCADTYKHRYKIYDAQTKYFGKSTRGYIVPEVARLYFFDLCQQSK